MKKALFPIIILITFSMYWLATIFFNLPDNFINLSLSSYSQKFNNVFFQKWSFFAPPPKFNERIYYVYFTKNNSLINSFEVLEATNSLKTKNAPFNSDDEILDYLLSNSVNSISEDLVELNDFYKNQSDSLKLSDSLRNIKIIANVEETYAFLILKNYSIYVAKHNNIDIKDCKVQIKISRLLLPKFSERNNPKIEPIEELFFQSNLF